MAETLKIGNTKITSGQVDVKEVKMEHDGLGIKKYTAIVQTRKNVFNQETGAMEPVIDDTEVSISKKEYDKIIKEMLG